MKITEVRIFLRESQDGKLRAYATLTFDNEFVVRNMKVIEGNQGLFIAMPSRRMTEACPKCGSKNPARSKFCSACGNSLGEIRQRIIDAVDEEGARQSEHRDIAHPITSECREYIQREVIKAYEKEKVRVAKDETSPSSEKE